MQDVSLMLTLPKLLTWFYYFKKALSLVLQAVEGEYMTGDEYVDFAADPTTFWMQKYLPRMFGALGAMNMMPTFPRISEIVDVLSLVSPFGSPEV